MSIIQAGYGGVAQEVDAITRAAHVTQRPINVGALGSYSHALKSGVEAAGLAANSPIWNFRWVPAVDTTSLAIIRRIKFSAWNLGTGFAAGNFVFVFFVARAFTVDDTGGTAATLTTNNAKMRSGMALTQATIRGGTTGVLTAGTRTKDAMPFRTLAGVVANAAFAAMLTDTTAYVKGEGEYPIVLATGEGLVIEATVPATGTWTWACSIDWDEVAAATFPLA